MNRPIRLPDVPSGGYPGGLEDRKHVVKLWGRTVQVVVDVTEIHLVCHLRRRRVCEGDNNNNRNLGTRLIMAHLGMSKV